MHRSILKRRFTLASVEHWSSVGQVSVEHRSSIVRTSVEYQLSITRIATDISTDALTDIHVSTDIMMETPRKIHDL